MSNKSSKEQGSFSPRLVTSSIALLSPSSLSTYSSIDKKFQGDSKVHKSLKYKNSVMQLKIEEKVEKSDVGKKKKGFNSNGGTNRSNKLSESYYYCTKGSTRQEQRITSFREKERESKLKHQSHNQAVNSKSIKSKLNISRRVEKVKIESNLSNQSFSNRQSLQTLISIHSNSGNIAKMKSLHTLSPDAEPNLEELTSERKNKILDDENEIFERMCKVLEEYQQKILREEKEKDNLMKENKKLKEKLEGISSSKRYRKVDEYNV